MPIAAQQVTHVISLLAHTMLHMHASDQNTGSIWNKVSVLLQQETLQTSDLCVNTFQVKPSNAKDVFHWHICSFSMLDLSHAIDGLDAPLKPLQVRWRDLRKQG